MKNNTDANNNVAFGLNALANNTTGNSSIAVGSSALSSSITGSDNIAIGRNALKDSSAGNYNIAIGRDALEKATTVCQYNIAIGFNALKNTLNSNGNLGIGVAALYSCTGVANIGIGFAALGDCTGTSNTAIGDHALSYCTSGSGNIQLGRVAATGIDSPVFEITTQNNRVVIGSTAVTHAYIQANWTIVSDARDKTNFAPIPHGLDFVKQLKPTAFQFKLNRESEETNGPLRYGFLAQDILALEGPDSVIIDNEDPEKLRYNGESLIPVLVQAIQELTAKVEALQNGL